METSPPPSPPQRIHPALNRTAPPPSLRDFSGSVSSETSGRPFIMARLPRTPALSQNWMGFCLRAAASHCFTFVRSRARSIRAVKRHFSGKIARGGRNCRPPPRKGDHRRSPKESPKTTESFFCLLSQFHASISPGPPAFVPRAPRNNGI